MIPLPYGGSNRYQVAWKDKLIAIGIVAAILLLIVLFVLEIPHFNRTLQLWPLLLIALALGITVGSIIGWRQRARVKELHEKLAVFLMVVVPFALFAPTLLHLSNRLLPRGEVTQMEVEFLSAEGRVSERFGIQKDQDVSVSQYIIYYLHNQEVNKFHSQRHPFPQAKQGDKVLLPIQTGLWGFDFIAPIE
ncbi:MAG: hypothetical protein AAFV95_18360 [Bacteroidota bacterium]